MADASFANRAHSRSDRTWSVKQIGAWSRGTELHARLVALYAEGLTYTVIGDRLGVTKGAIVGAVHRNQPSPDFPPRPSPVKGAGRYAGVTARRKAVAALGRVSPGMGRAIEPLPASVRTIPQIASVLAPLRPVFRDAAPRQCQFPIGSPGQADFRWCDAPITQAGPYCDDCRVLCYVPKRDRHEDAA